MRLRTISAPSADRKELIGGDAIVNVKSKAEAIEWTKRFLQVVGSGTTQVRDMHEPVDFQ